MNHKYGLAITNPDNLHEVCRDGLCKKCLKCLSVGWQMAARSTMMFAPDERIATPEQYQAAQSDALCKLLDRVKTAEDNLKTLTSICYNALKAMRDTEINKHRHLEWKAEFKEITGLDT